DITGEVEVLRQRLDKVSAHLRELYPTGQGELPPVLIAFAASFFDPDSGTIAVSCENPLPGQLRQRLNAQLGQPNTLPQSAN
ncbi:MAG: hypothetical protein GWN58_21990, partial [Anaerolineae bacterium]|nr:hypothetical protein [Anaerolineae bacterium]